MADKKSTGGGGVGCNPFVVSVFVLLIISIYLILK